MTSGIILGLDTDTETAESKLIDFIDRSQIPVLTINLLQALPKTPLWDRLAREGRLVHDAALESNVLFKRPHDDVVASWRRAIAHAYDAGARSSSASGIRSTPPIPTGSRPRPRAS